MSAAAAAGLWVRHQHVVPDRVQRRRTRRAGVSRRRRVKGESAPFLERTGCVRFVAADDMPTGEVVAGFAATVLPLAGYLAPTGDEIVWFPPHRRRVILFEHAGFRTGQHLVGQAVRTSSAWASVHLRRTRYIPGWPSDDRKPTALSDDDEIALRMMSWSTWLVSRMAKTVEHWDRIVGSSSDGR